MKPKNNISFTKYYLMDKSYNFVEVTKEFYDNRPRGYIDNRIAWYRNSDGADFFDFECFNVDARTIKDFFENIAKK